MSAYRKFHELEERRYRAKNEEIAAYERYARIKKLEAERDKLIRRLLEHDRDPTTT